VQVLQQAGLIAPADAAQVLADINQARPPVRRTSAHRIDFVMYSTEFGLPWRTFRA
jgi:hypothetical protein